MWQQWITGAMVFVAAAYALWYWMPAGLRRRLGRVQKRLGEKPDCGACSSCGGCGATTEPAKSPGPASGGSAARQVLWIQSKR